MTERPRKRSVMVALGLGLLAGCSREVDPSPDPCLPATFNPEICQEAVQKQGYRSRGVFVPHIYPQPYPYYFGNYGSYVSGGGKVNPAPASAYSTSPPARGGFGSTGNGVGG